jgi:NAD(P)-dependent dehydrogenase (short-subunit alcohol dehydrogenase family)
VNAEAASSFDMHGKVALVTGSTRGIGFAVAEALAQHGAAVMVSSRKPDATARARDALRARGLRAAGTPCNVADKDQLRALVDATVVEFGGIDVLVCSAGVNVHFGPLAEIGDDAYERIMGTNVRSTLWLANMALPKIAERGGGAVIIVASIAALAGTKWLGAYGISKAAGIALARNLAVEWGPRGVRVNCIAPGIIKTDFAKALYDDPAAEARAVTKYPLGRLGEPADVASAAVFLASRAGAFVTGQTIVIDGGATAGGFD